MNLAQDGQIYWALLIMNEYQNSQATSKILKNKLINEIDCLNYSNNSEKIIRDKVIAGYQFSQLTTTEKDIVKKLDRSRLCKRSRLLKRLIHLKIHRKSYLSIKFCFEKEYCFSSSSNRLYLFCNSKKSLGFFASPTASG